MYGVWADRALNMMMLCRQSPNQARLWLPTCQLSKLMPLWRTWRHHLKAPGVI